MSSRAALAGFLVTVLLLGGLGLGAYFYDRSKAATIGADVRVGNVDVSGLTPAQASAKLRRAVLEPLNQPVIVRARGKRFTLTPKAAAVGIDVEGSVRAALERSHRGHLLARTWRNLHGEPVGARVDLDIAYDERAIGRVVRRVAKALDKPAVDARVDLDQGDVTPQPSSAGRRVMVRQLRTDLRERLLETSADKTVRARTRAVEPKVTTDQLAERYPAILIVKRGSFQLQLYRNLKLQKTYGIAVGQVGLETPAGLYSVQNKAVDPAWSVPNSDWAGDLAGTVVPGGTPQNPLKARWMGIYDGAGIHGTSDEGSIGSAASHGCIRMRVADVVELYDQVPVNAPVYIS